MPRLTRDLVMETVEPTSNRTRNRRMEKRRRRKVKVRVRVKERRRTARRRSEILALSDLLPSPTT